MEIYESTNYREFIWARIKAMPRSGHGQLIKIAKHIGANPVIVSQVLKGDRDFTEEQAFRITNYFGLNGLESDYFMRMLAYERAGTHDLKQFYREAMDVLKRKLQAPKQRVGAHRELDETTKSVFYSEWTYSAVRLLSSIDKYNTVDAIAEHLGLGRARATEIADFLVLVGLCNRDKHGKLSMGVAKTHIDAKSRFVNNHRRNWRLKGLEGLGHVTPDDLFYSGPCSISLKDFQKIRNELVSAVGSMSKLAIASEPEFLACLNIDWFQI